MGSATHTSTRTGTRTPVHTFGKYANACGGTVALANGDNVTAHGCEQVGE